MSKSSADQPYPNVDQQANFSNIEEAVLSRWAKERTFQASIDQRDHTLPHRTHDEMRTATTPVSITENSTGNEYVFYDGPPFANGLPHYGHLLTSFVKDTVPRYQTMRGKKVDRRFGWDCHGLPVEMEAERQLGFNGKAAIVDYGIDRFNEFCRESVMQYTGEWEETITRAARWVDFTNDYKTMDLEYMESVMWAFKQLHDKGLAYEGYRVLPYCWECETPLSNFETRLDDSYRDRTDPAVTVMFKLSGFEQPTNLLVWTTTPWTLPSNLAVAVGPDIEYAIWEEDGIRYLLGAETTEKYKQQLANAQQIGSIKGSELVGRSYQPLFNFFADHENAFRVLAADFVDTSEGTGAVHMAPAFGEDDHRLCEANGIALVNPVDNQGRFTAEVADYQGLQVFDANPKIIQDLKANGVLIKREQYTHSYPHCWRTDTPLIYKAMSSWFIKVTAFRDRMVELNQQIDWIPEHIRDGRFGKWIADARDWSISRNRFWGSPIPVWTSDNPAYPRIDVYGSLDELERDFGIRPTDLHRPGIDQLVRPNPDDPTGQSTMRRVEDVMDCWFESGSMPFAQMHYPFENQERFEEHFPGDFIVEYQPQTRGWFYTLHVLATALFDRPAFRTCIAHGNVLGDDGRKMSKRLGNFPDVNEVFATLGADAVRWTLLSSPVLRGGETLAERKAIIESSRQVLVPIWNAWYFLSLYANTDGLRGHFRTDQQGVLDRYILAKTADLIDVVTEAMDSYDIFSACQAITRSIDALNNWWIRRSRDRFWRAVEDSSTANTYDDSAHTLPPTTQGAANTDERSIYAPETANADKQDAYDTLHTVLATLCRISAPLLPMLTEEIYTSLTGEKSVHLTDWPTKDDIPHDTELVVAMDFVREVCSEVLSVRKAMGLRVRLPLASITVAAPNAEQLRPFLDLISDETNVKEVKLTTDVTSEGEYQLAVIPGLVGPRIGGKVQQVLAAARNNDWTQDPEGSVTEGSVTVAGETLLPGEFELKFKPLNEETSRSLPGNVGVVVVDTVVTPELELEGNARDIVRLIQSARRDAGLHVSDRVKVHYDLDNDDLQNGLTSDLRPLLNQPNLVAYIEVQTLSELILVPVSSHPTDGFRQTGEIAGKTTTLTLKKIN